MIMDQTVTCVECGEEFNTEQELHQHNIEAHGMSRIEDDDNNPETATESCPVCGALFKTVTEREKHVHDTHGME